MIARVINITMTHGVMIPPVITITISILYPWSYCVLSLLRMSGLFAVHGVWICCCMLIAASVVAARLACCCCCVDLPVFPVRRH